MGDEGGASDQQLVEGAAGVWSCPMITTPPRTGRRPSASVVGEGPPPPQDAAPRASAAVSAPIPASGRGPRPQASARARCARDARLLQRSRFPGSAEGRPGGLLARRRRRGRAAVADRGPRAAHGRGPSAAAASSRAAVAPPAAGDGAPGSCWTRAGVQPQEDAGVEPAAARPAPGGWRVRGGSHTALPAAGIRVGHRQGVRDLPLCQASGQTGDAKCLCKAGHVRNSSTAA